MKSVCVKTMREGGSTMCEDLESDPPIEKGFLLRNHSGESARFQGRKPNNIPKFIITFGWKNSNINI